MTKLFVAQMQNLLRVRDIPLSQLLTAAWWVLLVFSVCLLLLDAAVFYRYGMERSPPEERRAEPPLRVDDDRIRSAAEHAKARALRFESATATPAIPNPFR